MAYVALTGAAAGCILLGLVWKFSYKSGIQSEAELSAKKTRLLCLGALTGLGLLVISLPRL